MTTDSASITTETKRLSSRFASLRAAQRALADLAHPAELEQTLEQGREILLELQSLSIRANEAGSGPRSEGQAAADRAAVQRVARLLDGLSARTGEILEQKPISQLRSHLRERSVENADELRGLIDVILEGSGFDSDRNLRQLEFLATLLSSEDCDTGRAVVREPSEVAPQIRAFSALRFDNQDPECMAAARAIADATEKLFEAEGIGDIRDNIRAYKRELGSRILHPSVLSAAVRYNVAMSNRVTGLVEGGRTVDRLADDLFAVRETVEAPVASASLFDATSFFRVVSALQMRLLEESSSDGPASAIAASVEIAALDAADLEPFEVRGDDHGAFLMRAAVTLGLIIRHEPRIGPDLRQLGIDPALLAGEWLHELAREMTATAHKLMAEARYAEASQLSEMKVKHLAVASTTPEHRGGRARPRATATVRREVPAKRIHLDGTWLRALFLGLGLLAFALLLSPLRGDEQAATSDFSELSPYLQSGVRTDDGGTPRFVGTLSASWDRLETSERVSVASQIGDGLRAQGVERVVLLDRHDRVQVRYAGGKVLRLEPKEAPRAAH
jgi:hypothetical protein